MSRLGISLYPEHSTVQRDKEYIKLAAEHGCKRIFTCLLSVEKEKEEILAEFRELIDYAHSFGMEVILDVAPFVFERLGVSYDDLSFFAQMHADGIRLDEGFDSLKEALMTYNPQGLKIEINASLGNRYLENIMSHHPDKNNLLTCHNFYPQRYTGISYEHFKKCGEAIRKLNLPIAAFVSASGKDTFGPWPVNEGLCTLEMHRDLPMDAAARHLFASGLVDDVIIANCYATKEEFEELSKIRPGLLSFKVELEGELHPTERKILYQHHHVVRGDMSEYMARSTQPRITFAKEDVPCRNTRDLKRGDIVIVNEKYSRYKGELHIVLKPMKNDGRKNVIGHIPEHELMLLDYICPWKSFGFIE